MIIANGTLFCDDGVFRKMDIETKDGIISSIGDGLAGGMPEILDAADCYVVPGLVDIHIHGAAGADFCDSSIESINIMARFLLKNGVTSFLGASLTVAESLLMDIYTKASPYIGKSIPAQAALMGINMEGPFFNTEKRGAQNAKYIRSPDFDMFARLYEASGGGIKTVAVAPETEDGLEFIRKARAVCNVSLAHSTADYSMAYSAFKAGAGSVTHIFNGMPAFHHRDPGIVGAAADSGAYAELICDGIHLHPSVVRAVFKLFGDDKVCLISDAIRACGLPEGKYELGGQTITVANGSAITEDGALAGSIVTLLDCLHQAVKFGIPIESALKASTINPAKAVGLDGKVGSLSRGKRADILILRKDLTLKNVLLSGILQA